MTLDLEISINDTHLYFLDHSINSTANCIDQEDKFPCTAHRNISHNRDIIMAPYGKTFLCTPPFYNSIVLVSGEQYTIVLMIKSHSIAWIGAS